MIDRENFYEAIASSTAHRPIRDRLSGEAMADPDCFSVLIETALNPSDKYHYKACWILELVLEVKIDWLKDYLSVFCDVLSAYRHDGAVRSVSKICLFAVQRDLKSYDGFLSSTQRQQVTEACFDWLISNTKVASKAYAMRTLYLLGKENHWIHAELKHILPQGFPLHSPAYQSAAKEILKKIR